MSDQPALTAEELKAEFDKSANLIKEYLNDTLLSELNTLLINLQNKDINLESAINTLRTTVTEAVTNVTALQKSVSSIQTTISGLKSGATTKISKGTSVPSSLAEGEVYLQYFN